MSQKPFWQQLRDLKLKGKSSASEVQKEKKDKSAFFVEMLKKAPKKCMESNKPLAKSMIINKMSVVCHILPKSKVKSMATDPRCIVFLDQDIHTDMDRGGCDYIRNMKIFPLMRERVADMWPEIPQNERRWVPECLRP